ncbi:MAG: hypothetical protein JNK66_05505 [Chitinophagales bacterium]|nr:hypothetical protein [Chitinophagales bacterium]
MDFQFIVDEKGRKSAVIVPIKEWEKRDAAYQLNKKQKTKHSKKKVSDGRTKEEILDGISRAVEEVKLIRAGKLKAKTLKDVLDEL